jgi:PncC family amidohydrolase
MDPTLQALAALAADRRGDRAVATAESFTAGLLSQALAAVPGSADFFRGGLVAYHSEVKWDVLGVEPGPVVTESAAIQMATGAARLLGADAAVATTGVAGPTDPEGRPPGTVVVGWYVDGRAAAETLFVAGAVEEVVHGGARAALTRLAAALTEAAGA